MIAAIAHSSALGNDVQEESRAPQNTISGKVTVARSIAFRICTLTHVIMQNDAVWLSLIQAHPQKSIGSIAVSANGIMIFQPEILLR